jgi:RNA polymerase sigma factor (sigma-70 family)
MELMDDDRTLLTAYARDGSEEAFATLTRRYLDLVYSAALRQLHDADQARDITQAVFLLLARKAKSLDPDTILAGWLYRTARFVSMEALRAEKRHKVREESMANPSHHEPSPEEIWQHVSPHLDEAMERIPESDRTALILRYFEDQPVRQLAATLGLSEEAAKKKVTRALEKLRSVLARRGISSTGSLLGTALIASAVQPAPAAVAAVISLPAAAALPATLLVKGTIEMMTYTKLQAGAAAAVLLLMAGGTGYVGVQHVKTFHEYKRARDPFSQVQGQVGNTPPSTDENQVLAEARLQNQQLREQARELYRLRDTVTQLRAEFQPGSAPPNSLDLRNAPRELQESAERLRELQYEHFVAAGQRAIALQPLTDLTDQETATYTYEINLLKNVGLALRIYASAHGDEFPSNLDVLLDGALLQGKMKEALQSGKYEFIRFNGAESKPSLPAVWWREPDEKGLRLVALNDGSVQRMREPAGIAKPGYLALAEAPKR